MKKSKYLIAVVLIFMTMGNVDFVLGALSPEEANKLGGPVLTPIGAERAGNADGSIPAWTGEPIPIPNAFKEGSGIRVDPFADEKPLFSINAKNMNQYADRLSEGVKAMMKKHPGYRIDVYETHRTMVFPQWVYDQTKKSATTCQLTNDGRTLTDCHGGTPFPIPKSGMELLWNHSLTFFAPEVVTAEIEAYNVPRTGRVTLSQKALVTQAQPWYHPDYVDDWRTRLLHSRYLAPPRRFGEAITAGYTRDWVNKGQVIWSYLPGQRRVRLAPDLSHDTPNPGTAGACTVDDAGIFLGDPVRYNWKIIGKKEMYVPYNAYKILYYRGDVNEALLPGYINPDLVRWELHRVWVLEATLKPDARHIYGKRVLYIDEDTWGAIMSDNYDKQGNFYRMAMQHPTYSYDARVGFDQFVVFYDLISNSYGINMWPRKSLKYIKNLPNSFWTPDNLAGSGLR